MNLQFKILMSDIYGYYKKMKELHRFIKNMVFIIKMNGDMKREQQNIF